MAAVQASISALDPSLSSQKTLKIENTEKRDTLIETEKKYQQKWAEARVFEPEAPTVQEIPFGTSQEELHKAHPKYMTTFAFPYMNGSLHAGHAFTISKSEFLAGFARMEGKRTLFPLGYHCTGMPIKACADKLIREIELFGKNFEGCKEEDILEESKEEAPAPVQETKTDALKFQAKKGKAAAKAVKAKYQFQIMLSLGLPLEEIHEFADPQKWLKYFPPLAKRDLTSFGARIDWRRQFVTTDANPYFDRFVQWQMKHLKAMGKIKYGKRYTVYSPKDGQACLDHDRSSGEGVAVQEYTAIKLKVKEWAESAQKQLSSELQAVNAYFVPATLRPETMYGQTCCFVSPTLTYGMYKVNDNEYYILSERSARNMSFQGIFPKWGEFPKVADLKGKDVIGTLVNAPLSVHKDGVRILPMETIKDSKGTAVVTCVPSDSPDDYATTLELQKKADYYQIKKEWAELEILPIIETPTYGNLTAKTLVEQLKINSSKDAKLAEAKELAYKEGFYQGKMLVGDHAGKPVQDAKTLVRQQLIDSGDAFAYAEPDGLVISRSADVCVAALLDQWFLNYGTSENGGDGEWAQAVLDHVDNGLNTFYPEARHVFVSVLNWLAAWACARSFGLGTKLPWDQSVKVESLSDSTIYMAYYTIAHYLHGDLFGQTKGSLDLAPEDMTDDVWDYIFGRAANDKLPETIGKEKLETMRRSFEYWYPLDSRVSGKDLVNNHLCFCLYIHAALFPKQNWPQAVRINGHLMLNGEKMSKSTGNFLTLNEATKKFGADATRIALADAGDEINDANFEESVANAVILKLFELRKWCEEIVSEDAKVVSSAEEYKSLRESGQVKAHENILRASDSPRTFWDDIFESELNSLVREARKHYEATYYKLALKAGFYDFTTARDFYIQSSKAIGPHRDLILRYIELQVLLLAPIAPHFSDYLWQEVLKKPDTIQNALFPEVPEPDATFLAARDYVRQTSSNITSAEGAQVKRLAKGKAASFDPKKEKKLTIFLAKSFPSWQDSLVSLVSEGFANLNVSVDIKSITSKIDKKEMKRAMPFVQGLVKRITGGEAKDQVLSRKLAFDEEQVLREMVPTIPITKLKEVEILSISDEGKVGEVVYPLDRKGEKKESISPVAASAQPGQPSFVFENVQESG